MQYCPEIVWLLDIISSTARQRNLPDKLAVMHEMAAFYSNERLSISMLKYYQTLLLAL